MQRISASRAGTVVYERRGDAIIRKNACGFGPGDLYCAGGESRVRIQEQLDK